MKFEFIKELEKSTTIACGIRSTLWTKKGELSIQTSKFHYCIPKENLKLEDYSHFEVAIFNNYKKILKGFKAADDLEECKCETWANGNGEKGILFAYVPKKLVEKLYLYMQE